LPIVAERGCGGAGMAGLVAVSVVCVGAFNVPVRSRQKPRAAVLIVVQILNGARVAVNLLDGNAARAVDVNQFRPRCAGSLCASGMLPTA
jgi:hypothetical protein